MFRTFFLIATLLSCASAFSTSFLGQSRITAQSQRSCSSLQMSVVDIDSEAAFDKTIQSAAGALVVVDYSTTWCGPCKVIAPKFDELSDKYPDAVFLKVRWGIYRYWYSTSLDGEDYSTAIPVHGSDGRVAAAAAASRMSAQARRKPSLHDVIVVVTICICKVTFFAGHDLLRSECKVHLSLIYRIPYSTVFLTPCTLLSTGNWWCFPWCFQTHEAWRCSIGSFLPLLCRWREGWCCERSQRWGNRSCYYETRKISHKKNMNM